MKKITLAEAATQVVLGLPQEDLQDLHEGAARRSMKEMISFLENYLKSKEPLRDKSEVEEMIEGVAKSLKITSHPIGRVEKREHALWAILYLAIDDWRLYDPKYQNEAVSNVKTMLATLKAVEKIKV